MVISMNHMIKRIEAFCKSKYFTWMLLEVGTVVILYYYLKKISYIHIVWELVDEYGYLANAAYLSKTDWSFMVNLYYGYGYSLLLVPLFWICSTGTQMIQGAVFINTLCMVLLFWVQFVLMSKLYKKLNRNFIVLASFVMCFYPYLMGSALKVVPECLLTLMIWVSGLLFYQALKKKKLLYYILLAVSLAYTFFVHTRALIFCAVVYFMVFVMLCQKKVKGKQFFVFVLSSMLFFVTGTMLKNQIIEVVYSGQLFASKEVAEVVRKQIVMVGQGTEVVVQNTLSLEYIIDRIRTTLSELSILHVISLACKFFYLFAASAGMFFVGLFQTLKETVVRLVRKKEIGIETAIKLMYAIAAVGMVVALIVNSVGRTETVGYFFYGRYYEYLVGPMVLCGLCSCMRKKMKIVEIVALIGGFLVCVYFAMELSPYLVSQEIYFDSNRMSALSYILKEHYLYKDVILQGAIFTMLALGIAMLFNRFRYCCWMIPVLLFGVYRLNDKVIADNIIKVNMTRTAELAVVEYIHENYEKEEVYFLNGDELQYTVYTCFQALLGKEKLNMIQVGDIWKLESGDLLISFYQNPYFNLVGEKTKLMEIGSYELYIVD